MAGGLHAVDIEVVTPDPPEAPTEVWSAASRPTTSPEKACDDCTPCAMGGMAEGLFAEETLLHAARAAPSTNDDTPTPTLACSPQGEAGLPDARTAAPLPANEGSH